MATYGELKTRIARELNRNDLSDEISGAVQSAINYYETHPFTFNTKRVALSLSPGESTDGPSDAAEIYILRVKFTPSVWGIIDRRSYIDLETLHCTPQITGDPQVYAWYQQKIWTYPTPSATHSAQLSYFYKLSPIINDGDSNSWTEDAEELIRMHSEIDLYETLLRGKNALATADRLRFREAEYLNKLDQDFTRLYSTGRVSTRSLINNSRRWY